MGWRTVVVTKNCKLSYKNGYLLIQLRKLQNNPNGQMKEKG